MVEQLEDPALDADHREARGAQEDEAHVAYRAVGDQPFEIDLGETNKRRVHHRYRPEHREDPPQALCGIGEDPKVDGGVRALPHQPWDPPRCRKEPVVCPRGARDYIYGVRGVCLSRPGLSQTLDSLQLSRLIVLGTM